MNKRIWPMRAVLLAVAAAGVVGIAAARAETRPDNPNAPRALFTLSQAPNWQVGASYGRLNKAIKVEGVEEKLRADVIDATFAVSPLPWLQLYAQAGASEAKVADLMRDKGGFSGGGLAGAGVNLFQYNEGIQHSAWRFTVRLAGQYEWRTSSDEGSGKLSWGEAQLLLPLDFHLTFSRSYRHSFLGEFHSLQVFAGPALSKINGKWKQSGATIKFREAESAGVAGGGDLWLMENLSFGARVEWFEKVSARVNVRYLF